MLFLDEPTTGLDPRARNEVWAMVRELLATGVTVLLTTQYLDEVDQLADEISVVDHGRVIATGTPEELKAKTGAQTLEVAPGRPGRAGAGSSLKRRWAGGGSAGTPEVQAGHGPGDGERPGRAAGRGTAFSTTPVSSLSESWRYAARAWTRSSWP